MTEKELVIRQFEKNFSNKGKYVIYGLGENTKVILNHFNEEKILGLMDGFRKMGECFGYPILSEDRVSEMHPDAIIIIARKNSTRIIAKRIEAFCRKENIELYDINGEDLLQENLLKPSEHPYFQKNMEQLWQEIEKHHVVSFDVFDTLLMRQVLYPEDVFSLVEQQTGVSGFAKCRQAVERELYREGGQPTLSDIYHRMQAAMEITSSLCRELYETELSLEGKILLPRREMVEIFCRALQAGKRVWLISDMYLPSEFLARVCRVCGIDGWEKLVVSCEYGVGKTQGLFQLLKRETKESGWLHIGDSREADDIAAVTAGLDVFPICSAFEMLNLSSWQMLAGKAEKLEERLIVGGIIAQVFNSPFALAESKGRPTLKTAELLGYNIFGPVLTALFYWLKQQMDSKYDVVLWGARDGYVLNNLQHIYQRKFPSEKLPRPIYYYVSRMAGMAWYPTSRGDILYMAATGFSGTPSELLMKRFNLRFEEIQLQEDGELLDTYVLRHEDIILRRAGQLRAQARMYWDDLGISVADRIAFFDLVSSGTCQLCTEKLIGRTVDGFYLIHVLEDYVPKVQLNYASYIESDYLSQLKSYISANYEPLETVVMSHEPSLIGFDENGKLVFGEEKRMAEDLSNLQQVQKGIYNFFDMFSELWGASDTGIRSEFVNDIYMLLRRQYTNIVADHLAEQTVTDDFTNRDFVMKDMFD